MAKPFVRSGDMLKNIVCIRKEFIKKKSKWSEISRVKYYINEVIIDNMEKATKHFCKMGGTMIMTYGKTKHGSRLIRCVTIDSQRKSKVIYKFKYNSAEEVGEKDAKGICF